LTTVDVTVPSIEVIRQVNLTRVTLLHTAVKETRISVDGASMARYRRSGRLAGHRPTWSRIVLLGISVLTLVGTTEVPAYAGGSGSPAITSSPSSPTTADPLTWAFTSSAAATSCELDRGTTVVSALATCVSDDPSATFDVSGQPGGSYTFTVYDAAAVDVVTDTPSDTSTVDVAPPAPTVVRSTDSPGTSRSPQWTFDTPAGATIDCELDDSDGHAVDSQSSCVSPYDADLTGGDDGQYTLSVTATAGGVTGAAATSSYLLDTTAPDAPTVTAATATGHDLTPTFEVSGVESGATTACTATAPDGSDFPGVACGTTVTLHLTSSSPDGQYTVSVTETDAVGNTSSAGTASYTLDTVAPAAPSVTAPTSPSTDRTPSFTVTDSEAGTSFQCSVSGPSPASASTCGPMTTLDLAGADNGDYVLSVTAIDAAGNVSGATTASYRLDAAAPPAPSVDGPGIGRGRFPIFAVTDGQDDVSFTCTVSGPSTAHVSQCGASTWLDLAGAVDGDYTVSVTATDPLGQASLAGTATYRLDTVAPMPPVVTSPDSPGSSLAPTFAVTDVEPDAFLLCTVTGLSSVSVTHCTTSTLLDLAGGTDGTYTLSVTATDAAGNTSDPTTASYTLDTAPPPVPDVVAPTSPSNDPSPTFGITDTEAGARLDCILLDPLGAIVSSGLCPAGGSFDTTGSPDGSYVLVVTASDHAGNTASASAAWSRDTTPPPAPVVTPPPSPSSGVFAGFGITDAEGTATLSCLMTASDGSVVLTGACPPDGNVDTSGFVDGIFSLTVTATDDVGNSSSTTVTWTRDTAAPPRPTVTAPASPSNDTTPTFTLADAESGTTLHCVLVGPDGTTVAFNADCPAGGTVPTGGAGDGSYALTVTAIDEVGNVSPAATATYTLDTTAPPVPTVDGPASPSHDRSPDFTVSDTEPGVTLSCTVTGLSPVTVNGCGATPTLDLATAADDTYTLSVTATDAAGNTSTAGTASFTLDSISPPAPTLSAPASPSQGRAPVFSVGDSASGVTFDCTISPTVPISGCGSAPTLDLSVAADGTYTLSVTATDAAGNTSDPTTASYTLDTTAPAAPTVVAPPSPSSDTTPDFWITDTETSATLNCEFTSPGGTALVLGPCPSGGHFDTAGGGDGAYTLLVMATDAAGNASSTTVSWTLDTTPPPAPVVVAPASPDRGLSPTFTISDGEATAALTCLFTAPGGQTVSSGACPSDGTFPTAGFADGVYTLVVTATDAAGNAASTTVHWTRDRVAPPAPLVVAPASPGQSQAPSFTVSDTEPGVSYTCSTSPTVPVTACGPTTTLDLSATANGPYSVTVSAVDAAGNTSAGTTASYTLDTAAPPVPVVTAPASPRNGRSPSFTVTDSETAVTFSCTVSPLVPIAGCGPTAALDLSGAADGAYTLSVTATDAAGNTSAAGSATYTLDTATPPTPVVTGPTIGNTRSPSFTVTDSQPGLSYTCTVTPLAPAVPVPTCGPTTVLDLSGAADRAYTLSVVGTNTAGNSSLAGTATYTLDSVVPPRPTVAVSPSTGSSPFPAFAMSDTEAGVTLTCTVSPVVPLAGCGPTATLNLLGAPDGSYRVSVTATDPAGNVSAARSAAYVYDTTAPPSPAVTPVSSGGQSRTPSFAVSDSEPGTSFLCSITPAGTVTSCANPTRVSLAGAPDGIYTVSVSAMDAAGNVSPPTAVTYQLDTTGPPAPVLVAPASPGKTRFPVFGVSDTELLVTYSCTVSPAGSVLPCGPTTAKLDLTGVPNGLYTVSVTATDLFGNVSNAATATYLLDTVKPPVPVVTVPATGNDPQPSFAISESEGSATLSCVLTASNGHVLDSVSPCNSPYVADLRGLSDGSYTLSVTATDMAGNVSAAGTATYTFDTHAPPVPVVTVVATGHDPLPSFAISESEGGAMLTCVLTAANGHVVDSVTSCSSPYIAHLAGLSDGSYTLSVTATDAAGNTSAAGTATYLFDTVKPPTPVVTVVATGHDPLPSFAISESEGSATLSCVLTVGNGRPVTTLTPCTTPYVAHLAGLSDGSYTLSVTATDAAGNTSAAGTATYIFDTHAPVIPVVSVPATGNVQPSFAISEPETTAALRCVLTDSNGNVVGTAGSCISPYTPTLPGDGSYTLSVTATDAAGNTSDPGTATYIFDTVRPPVPTVTVPVTGNVQPSFVIGERESGTTLTCTLTDANANVISGPSTCSTPYRPTLPSDGSYTVSVTATDAAGNTSAPGTATYILDTVNPPVPAVTVPATGHDQQPDFAIVESETSATLSCVLTDASAHVVDTLNPCTTPYDADLRGLSDGSYTVSVTATDAAGNTSDPGTATYLLDTVAPPPPTVIQPTPLSSRTTAFWQWHHDPNELDPLDDTADCVLTGPNGFVQDLGSCPSPDAFTTRLTAAEGVYTLTVTLTDKAGNRAQSSATYDFDRTAGIPPVVIMHSPASGIGQSRHPVWFVMGGNNAILHCQLFRGDQHGTPLSAVTRCALPLTTYSLAGLADGTYTLKVTAQEVDGTTVKPASVGYILDTTPPHAPKLLGGTSMISTVKTPQWSFELPPDATAGRCEWSRNGTNLITQTHCNGTTTFSLAGLSDGPITVKVFAFDAAGNRSEPLVINYVLDRSVPARPGVSPPSGSGSTAVWTVHGNPADNFTCTLFSQGNVVVSAETCGVHPTYQMGLLPSATYTLSVTQTDVAGARSAPGSASWAWVNAGGGSGPTHHGGGPGGGTGKHGPGGPHQGVVKSLPKIVQRAIHHLGNIINHPGPTVRHVVHIVVPVPNVVSHAVQSAISAVGQAGGGTGFPLILIGLVVVFLVVQNRIDRRDPKLAFVSVAADDLVEFKPPPSREDGA
jgi:predicted phage tail protein